MMAMSMGTTPVDDGGWAFHVDLYDSSPAGGSASVPLRRFFTPRAGLTVDPRKKFRWTDRAHGPDDARFRSALATAKPDRQARAAADCSNNSLQTKDFLLSRAADTDGGSRPRGGSFPVKLRIPDGKIAAL
ncbi:hypothetical protein [Azospirillum sp. B2RO_4]|uniref:hypothetical protein n=1 Tax=Azospirillum sp. B2RO_4 TaxID=3027796 RepID=UPI003DA9F94A